MSGRRIAILIGNASFPHEQKLPDLVCPPNDVEGLSAQLKHPERGGFDVVEQVTDKGSGDIRRQIAKFMRQAEPEDTVLFFYSGHGKLDDRFALYLCAHDSEVDVLEATAISISYVWDLLEKCRARRSIVLLDCCYSGAAAGVRARGNVEDALKVKASGAGTYLLTASDAIETAQEKEGDKYGVFTKHFIAGLESGEADREGNGVVTMDDMYNYICRSVRDDSPQKPTRQVGGHDGNIVIAKSGKDPRKDRADEVKRMLFQRVADGDLDSGIAEKCAKIARQLPSQLTNSEEKIDTTVSDLLAGRIDFGKFVTRYHQASVHEEAPEIAAPPKPVPEPESIPKKKASPRKKKKQAIWGIAQPFTVGKPETKVQPEPKPKPKPADNDDPEYEGFTGWWRAMQDRSLFGKSPGYINYGAPILLFVAAVIFSVGMEPVHDDEQLGMAFVVGGMLMAVTVMHMKANRDRLSIGGMVLNGLVCGLGALSMVIGIIGYVVLFF